MVYGVHEILHITNSRVDMSSSYSTVSQSQRLTSYATLTRSTYCTALVYSTLRKLFQFQTFWDDFYYFDDFPLDNRC